MPKTAEDKNIFWSRCLTFVKADKIKEIIRTPAKIKTWPVSKPKLNAKSG